MAHRNCGRCRLARRTAYGDLHPHRRQIFQAYASPYPPGGTASSRVYEQAIMGTLAAHTAPQPGRLGCRHTGAHDIVFPEAPLLSLCLDRPGVVVEGEPSEAMTWRVGHMRSGDGAA